VLARDPYGENATAGEAAAAPEKPASDEICRIYEKYGRCKYGNECMYRHDEAAGEEKTVKAQSSTKGEEALCQLVTTHSEVVEKLKKAFGLTEFPFEQLFTRAARDTTHPRNIYFVSAAIEEMISCDTRARLKVINCGVKAFERVELKDPVVVAPYRVCQEMTKLLLPRMTKRKVKVGIKCFRMILTRSNHSFDDLEKLDSDSEAPFKEQIEELSVGTFVIYAEANGETFTLSALRAKTQLQLYVGKEETQVYKSQLDEVYGPLVVPDAVAKVVAKNEPDIPMEVVEDKSEPTHVKF